MKNAKSKSKKAKMATVANTESLAPEDFAN